jgi:hypothetical protein
MPLKIPQFLCQSRTRHPELLKAALNVSVADERFLDSPKDLTGKTTAQIGLDTHPCQDGRGVVIDSGCRTPDYPCPVASSRAVDRPEGSAEELEKVL